MVLVRNPRARWYTAHVDTHPVGYVFEGYRMDQPERRLAIKRTKVDIAAAGATCDERFVTMLTREVRRVVESTSTARRWVEYLHLT